MTSHATPILQPSSPPPSVSKGGRCLFLVPGVKGLGPGYKRRQAFVGGTGFYWRIYGISLLNAA